MKERLRYPFWKGAHHTFPVFVYTIKNAQGRVTQAHYSNDKLHVRQTETVSLQEEHGHFVNVKTLLRWVMGEPIGNTKWADGESSVEGLIPPSTPRGPLKHPIPAAPRSLMPSDLSGIPEKMAAVA